MTTRTITRGVFYRRLGMTTVVMGLIAFALGYLLHPM